MSLISERNKGNSIEERFITESLNFYGKNVMEDIRRYRSTARVYDRKKMNEHKTKNGFEKKFYKTGFQNSKWNDGEKFTVDKNTLTYSGQKVARFVDMKKRRTSKFSSSKSKVVQHNNHNKIIFSHKRFLIKQLSFGFTDEVKAQFRKLQDDVN